MIISAQLLAALKSKDQRVQLKAAKEFYACLISELKQVKPDNETNFVDSLIPDIRKLANEANQNFSDKQACIYIITSIINLDNINIKVRKKHQTSFFRWLKNLLACPDLNVIHMASRAMGKYAQAGVECDVEFKSGLEHLRDESKRFQGILLVKELSLASPSRLFLNSDLFYQNIMSAICDRSPEIRYEAIELFRLSLIISVSRETLDLNNPNLIDKRIRRVSTNSSLSSLSSNNQDILQTSQSISSSFTSQITPNNQNFQRDPNFTKYRQCFKNSIRDLEQLLKEISNKSSSSSSTGHITPREDRCHGYLLIILEILKFSRLEFEQSITKYLSKYNIYHQQMEQAANNAYYASTLETSGNSSPAAASASGSSSSNTFNTSLFSASTSLIENTAKSCEEMHSSNLLKLLPHSCFDPSYANDPFMFLFQSEKISINIESRTCQQMISEKFDVITVLVLRTIHYLNLGKDFSAASSTSSSSSNSATSPSNSYRCLQETVMELLPRLARFDQQRFSDNYLKEALQFLTNLNNSTAFISPSTPSNQSFSAASGQTSASSTNKRSSSLTPSITDQNQYKNVNNSFGLGTLKSEVIFTVGILSLALANKSEEFRKYSQQFIEIIRTSPLMNSKEVQRKRLALTITTNNLNILMSDSSMQQSLAQLKSSSGKDATNGRVANPTSAMTPSSSSSSIYMSSLLSTVSMALTGGSSQMPPQPVISSLPVGNNTSANTLSILTQMKAAQINELNAIMACLAMFASSMVSKNDLQSSPVIKTPTSASTSSIIDSIMVLLEPLMLCSGGVTYTMRYFLNEISLHIPELKQSIHENLLKILSQILTGKPLYQIIQAISVSASHLIKSNNFYSLMSNSTVTGSSVNSPSMKRSMSAQTSLNATQNQQYQQMLLIERPPPQRDVDSLLQALQTLRAFEFSSIYVIGFLRYCVDFYLQHDSRLVKIEAVITTSSLLSKLISTLDAQDSRSLISIISCALRKLLICAITDYEPDVRYHVLNSLDSDNKFNMFVALPENLNILFMCVRDERAEIRELSASMISRLSASNSAYILPFIRKILMQLLTEIDIYPDISQREKSVRLMGHLLSHAPRLVNLYIKTLLDCLHSKVCEYRHDVPFASSIVTVIGQLASQSSAETIQHFDTIVPFLIESMQDFYYVQLKHTALWTLGQIIANTGYVIEPYKKYPVLLEILLGFLQTETVPQIRRETIKILGLIGAIDPFDYKQTVLKSRREELANAAASAAVQQLQKSQIAQMQQAIGGTAAAPSTANTGPVHQQPGVHATAQAAAANNAINNYNTGQNIEQASLDPIEMLISMNSNGSLDEYYPALGIHLMMKTIKNSVSVGVRKDTTQSLVYAMRSLDKRCVNYVKLVIPPFLELIKSMNDNSIIDLINHLGSLIGYIKKHIEPYLNSILSFIESYWNSNEIRMIVALIDLVQSIANVMDIEFKRFLPRVLPLILKQLGNEIADGTYTNTTKILSLLRLCTCCLENYVHLILSQFAEYLTLVRDNLKKEIMFTIYTFSRQITISDNCAILFQSFIKILEQNSAQLPPPNNQILVNNPLIQQTIETFKQQHSFQIDRQTVNNSNSIQMPSALSITYFLFSNTSASPSSLTNECLSTSANLGTLTIETLYLLARQMGGRFFVYAPMFDRILLKNRTYENLYEQLMMYCREATYHTINPDHVLDNPFSSLKLTSSTEGSSNAQGSLSHISNQMNDSPAASTPPKYSGSQTVSFSNLKVCIDGAENLTSREGWQESFRKHMASIVKETPVSTLRACSLIHDLLYEPDLFNACFVSIWVKLNEREQNEIIRYLELALTNSDVPEIIKIILNLAEFVERCDIGFFLPLDYRLLAEKAFQAKAYAKALHYVEEQFNAVMVLSASSTSESNYSNGVGGISGAAGRGISTVGGPSAIASMSVRKQQETLIYLLEKLVTLNHELQRTEAAMGVLDFAQKYLKNLVTQTEVKEGWFEKLHQWQKALKIYEKELNVEQPIFAHKLPGGPSSFFVSEPDKLNKANLNQLMGRLRCLKGLGEWKKLHYSCQDLLNYFTGEDQSKTEGNESKNQQLAVQASFPQSSSGSNFQNNSFSGGHKRQASSNTLAPGLTIGNILVINPSASQPSNVIEDVTSLDQPRKSFLNTLKLQEQIDFKSKIAEMGAAACWGLGNWEQMQTYVQYLPENSFDGSLYKSVLALTLTPTNGQGDNKQNALSLIEHTRDLLDVDLTSMASQSYERSYQAIIEAQVLAELEEIITYKSTPNKRDWLRETWWKRLQGCERSLEYWHRLLLVRSIVLPKEKEIKPWLKFSSLCQKNGYLGLSHQILTSLLGEDEVNLINGNANVTNSNTNQKHFNLANGTRDYELCKYSYFKYLYANGNKRVAFNKLNEFHNELKAQLVQFEEYTQQIAANQSMNVQIQVPPVFQMYNSRELQKRKVELDTQIAKCYLKLGSWQYELENFREPAIISRIISYYEAAKDHNRDSYKAWQAWAYANYEAIQFYKNNTNLQPATAELSNRSNDSMTSLVSATLQQQLYFYVIPAIKGFFTCIKLSSSASSAKNQETNCLQDTLRLLTIWFDYCNNSEIYDVLYEGIKHTPTEIWLQVIPQLIARIDTNKQFVASLIHNLLVEVGRVHPQALVYRLILASKCSNNTNASSTNNFFNSTLNGNGFAANQNSMSNMGGMNNQQRPVMNVAASILNSLREHNNTLVEQAKLVSEELIRVAILWHEMWHESLEEASKLYFGEKNVQGMLDTLDVLHMMMDRGATTNKETAFKQAYGRDLNEARDYCRRFMNSQNTRDIDLAWEKYYSVFKRITKQLPQMTTLELSYVSPRLMVSRDLELAVPGTYEPNKPLIRIKTFNANIQVIASKQRPRRISIFGSDGREYVFLLKGHEDLRQDERVMQIFGLVNNLLLKNHETARRDLAIQRYSVIPLSQNSGLIEWLLNCDTLHSLIREYREKKRFVLNFEHKIITKLAYDYEHLTPIQKVQIFELAIKNSCGDDLAKILWHKSLTAEKWLERRTNYTRSLGVMSMVGYVLGLGDRHPSNLMLDRNNGKIIHVDFGDCFETAMTREKFPEKIPFRLTRMLKNAMEVTGIEGTFRRTCESVIKVLRNNRDSVMAVLEAFVYDPLVYWKLVEATNAATNQTIQGPNLTINSTQNQTLMNQSDSTVVFTAGTTASTTNLSLNNTDDTVEETNRKAIQVLNRVKDKLTGKDFNNTIAIDEIKQVDLLIKQATSSENLCQCFIGWCAWW